MGFGGFCRVLLLLLFSGLRAVGWFCRVSLLLLFSGLREVGSWALVCSGLCGLGSFNRGLLFFPRSGFEKLYRVWVRSFAGFWGVLPGFGGFCFCNLIFGSEGGLVFGWAGLCWAGRFFFLLWNLILASWGRLPGFAFCFCRFGWAGLPLGLAGLGSPHARFRENSKRMKMQYEAKLTPFLFILLLRV